MEALTGAAVAPGLPFAQTSDSKWASSAQKAEKFNHGHCSGTQDGGDLRSCRVASIPLMRQALSDARRLTDRIFPVSISWSGFLALQSSSSSFVPRDILEVLDFHSKQHLAKVIPGVARAFETEVEKEFSVPDENTLNFQEFSYLQDSRIRSTSPTHKNKADDASLHNPLLRLERMGCGWFGVIMEWDGVVVEDDLDIERKVWAALAEEEGRRPPPMFVLQRVDGMKNEQAIAEVLCWSRDSRQMKRLAQRKEELFQEMQGGTYRLRPGSSELIGTLTKHKVPIAVVSTRPRHVLEMAIEAVGMGGFFSIVIAAENVHRGKPDPEMFFYAAQLLDVIPERCIVFGNSNSSVEAAHDALMKCVAVCGKHPVFELGAADLVVRRLDDLSMVDLKNLADLDSPEFQPPQPELLLEAEEEEEPASQTRVALCDHW